MRPRKPVYKPLSRVVVIRPDSAFYRRTGRLTADYGENVDIRLDGERVSLLFGRSEVNPL